MQWDVVGADRVSGDDRRVTLDADTEHAARLVASRYGILVADISATEPVAEPVYADPATALLAMTAPEPVACQAEIYRPPLATAPSPPVYVQQVFHTHNGAGGGSGSSVAFGLGIAALVLGIVAVLSICVPPATLGFGLLGMLLGGIGAAAGWRHRGAGMAIAGMIVCLVPLALYSVVVIGGVALLGMGAAVAAKGPAPAVSGPVAPPVVPASQPVRRGDIQVELKWLKVDSVLVEDLGGEKHLSKPYFAIMVHVRNLSSTQKADYRSWAGRNFSMDGLATLADDKGNTYKRIDFGFDHPVGSVESGSIYPGAEISDIIVFERPVDAAGTLRLELPVVNFGASGDPIRFDIKPSEIEQ